MEQRKLLKEIYVGLVSLLFSLLVIFILIPNQIQLVTTFGEGIGVNSRTFPYFAAAIMGVAAVVLILDSLRKYLKLVKEQGKIKQEKESNNLHSELLALLLFIIFLGYGIAFDHFGFIIASIIFPPIPLFLLGSRKIWQYASVYGFVIVIFVTFQYLLKIQLI